MRVRTRHYARIQKAVEGIAWMIGVIVIATVVYVSVNIAVRVIWITVRWLMGL